MKTILTLKLTSTFRNLAIAHAENYNADITIQEFFRDQFVYATFKTFSIQLDSITGVYILTVQPSVKDEFPLTTLVERFCQRMFDYGVTVDGYNPPELEEAVDTPDQFYTVFQQLSAGELLAWAKATDENFTTDGDCVATLLEARKAFEKVIYLLEHAE